MLDEPPNDSFDQQTNGRGSLREAVVAAAPDGDGSAYLRAMTTCELSLSRAWVCYLIVGGSHDFATFNQGLTGAVELNPREHDRLAAALNDELIDQGHAFRVPYSEEINRAGHPVALAPLYRSPSHDVARGVN